MSDIFISFPDIWQALCPESVELFRTCLIVSGFADFKICPKFVYFIRPSTMDGIKRLALDALKDPVVREFLDLPTSGRFTEDANGVRQIS